MCKWPFLYPIIEFDPTLDPQCRAPIFYHLNSTYFYCVFRVFPTHITSIGELQEFFRGTFIQKQVGYIPDETESYYIGEDRSYAQGFNPSWSVYRFHHVCVRGGGDGLYAGMVGTEESSSVTGTYKNSLYNELFQLSLYSDVCPSQACLLILCIPLIG